MVVLMAALALAAAVRAGETPPRTEVRAALVDLGLPPQVDRAVVEREATRLLTCAGVSLRWERAEGSAELAEGTFGIVVLDEDRGRRPHSPMGVAAPGSAARSAWIVYPAVEATVTNGAWPVNWPQVSVAVGRVVAHELVHLLAPEVGHARVGLMRSVVSGTLLVTPGLTLDAGTCAAVAAALDRRGTGCVEIPAGRPARAREATPASEELEAASPVVFARSHLVPPPRLSREPRPH
jgi:hypothetical protein